MLWILQERNNTSQLTRSVKITQELSLQGRNVKPDSPLAARLGILFDFEERPRIIKGFDKQVRDADQEAVGRLERKTAARLDGINYQSLKLKLASHQFRRQRVRVSSLA